MFRRRNSLYILAAIATAVTAPAAIAHEYLVGDIKIVHPWTRQPPAAATVAAGFMTLTNTGTSSDRLLGGTFVSAARLEVHEMLITDGVMRMRQLPSGLEIKPGETVVLKPGSYHVMFLDLSKTPAADTKVKGTLVFERAGTIDVEYKVEAAGARGSGAHEHGSGAGKGTGSGAGANGSQ